GIDRRRRTLHNLAAYLSAAVAPGDGDRDTADRSGHLERFSWPADLSDLAQQFHACVGFEPVSRDIFNASYRLFDGDFEFDGDPDGDPVHLRPEIHRAGLRHQWIKRLALLLSAVVETQRCT